MSLKSAASALPARTLPSSAALLSYVPLFPFHYQPSLTNNPKKDVEVPGGQQVYIAPGGALKFTVPHSAAMPPGSIKSGFEYQPGQPFGHWTWTGESGSGWMACPADGAYQVFANVEDAEVPSGDADDCIPFDAMTRADKSGAPAAWEYI